MNRVQTGFVKLFSDSIHSVPNTAICTGIMKGSSTVFHHITTSSEHGWTYQTIECNGTYVMRHSIQTTYIHKMLPEKIIRFVHFLNIFLIILLINQLLDWLMLVRSCAYTTWVFTVTSLLFSSFVSLVVRSLDPTSLQIGICWWK